MYEELNDQVAHLRDTSKGWVHRRDAADYLGKTIQTAVAALRAAADDKDTDVRAAAADALSQANAVLAGIVPATPPGGHSLEELAKACEKPGRREVRQEGDTFVVTAQLRDGRTQQVTIAEVTRNERTPLVQVLTYCGGFNGSAMPWALKTNTQLARCAVGIAPHDGADHFVLVNCIPREEATPDQVRAVVKEMAFYGDWLENKLTGGDTH